MSRTLNEAEKNYSNRERRVGVCCWRVLLVWPDWASPWIQLGSWRIPHATAKEIAVRTKRDPIMSKVYRFTGICHTKRGCLYKTGVVLCSTRLSVGWNPGGRHCLQKCSNSLAMNWGPLSDTMDCASLPTTYCGHNDGTSKAISTAALGGELRVTWHSFLNILVNTRPPNALSSHYCCRLNVFHCEFWAVIWTTEVPQQHCWTTGSSRSPTALLENVIYVYFAVNVGIWNDIAALGMSRSACQHQVIPREWGTLEPRFTHAAWFRVYGTVANVTPPTHLDVHAVPVVDSSSFCWSWHEEKMSGKIIGKGTSEHVWPVGQSEPQLFVTA